MQITEFTKRVWRPAKNSKSLVVIIPHWLIKSYGIKEKDKLKLKLLKHKKEEIKDGHKLSRLF